MRNDLSFGKPKTSICLKCFHLRCCPAVTGEQVWCSEEIFLGTMPKDHPFLMVNRACRDFDDEGITE